MANSVPHDPCRNANPPDRSAPGFAATHGMHPMTSTTARRPTEAKRVFLLGATGTIGRATAAALIARGHDVVGFVRPRSAKGDPQTNAALSPMSPGALAMCPTRHHWRKTAFGVNALMRWCPASPRAPAHPRMPGPLITARINWCWRRHGKAGSRTWSC